jgi:hypothetical protein
MTDIQQSDASSTLTQFIAGLAAGPRIVASATSYCDKIAATIFDALKARDPDGIIVNVGPVQWDLHPTEGYLLSPQKTLEVTDRNGNRYLVTVEDLR